jgi:ArsR family transcriptional regulator, arsenate/arsenite/antimonite-responsive transcriptional repressor
MKQNDYNNIALSLAGMLNALSHPARLQIMLHLAKYNGCPARSISERLPLAKSTVSEHLNKLKEAGLISCEVDGTSSYYKISEQGYQLLRNGFSDFIELMEKHRASPQKCCPVTQKQQKILTELA